MSTLELIKQAIKTYLEHRVGEALGVYVIVKDFMDFYKWYKEITINYI